MSDLSRRSFLKRSAMLAAAPLVLPSRVFGQNAPSNRINVGIIGVGAQGRFHFSNLIKNSDVQIIGICDVDSSRAQHFADAANASYGTKNETGAAKGCKAFKDFREMLAMPGLDAVFIATPNHWHSVISVAACRAGKDVYCEKPLADTIYESRAMADAAAQYGAIFQTGSMQRSDNTFRFASELVRNGKIGQVKEVWVSIGGPPKLFCDLPEDPCPPTIDWDFWCGPSLYRPYSKVLAPDSWNYPGFPNWRGYSQYGGGGQSDWGAHHFDIAQWGLGMDESGPVEVTFHGENAKPRYTYVYASGIKMFVGEGAPGAGTTWVGEGGKVGVNRGALLYTEPANLADIRLKPSEIHLYESKDQFQNFIACVKSRRQPICTAETGHRTSSVCAMGLIAARMPGVTLKWDPKAERFTNSDDANRLLRREMRAPWTV